ncbi:C6 zinc finger domain protein [Paecilomyces variotii No. 5]|uniref:C6 zinc finger domain protein n=1 Tax=Byssochlamys spectabilis (strain No. 5 / NBRC 109023) TaxID=1356009 RepID=V5G5P2_BYSSN|nr:C6 zinc finger domain protein [Paecilomyces variotii No. 5]
MTSTTTTYYPTMPYTQERLELALNLFCRTKPHLKHRGLPHKHLEENLKAKYELRWGTIKNAKNAPSTWIDDDNSGDYDPKQDAPKRKCSKARLAQRAGADRPAKRRRRLSATEEEDEEEEDEPGLLVTLKMTSEKGKAFLAYLRDYGSNEYEDGDQYADTTEPGLLCRKRYSLRRRGKTVSSLLALFEHQPSPGASQASTQSLLSLDPGHPAARGCKSCWEFNQECSLIDRTDLYPCQLCREDGLDCELIIEPRQKRGCENCKRKRKIVCSYLQSNEDHHLPCKQCQVMGIRCCAGPAKDKQIRVMDDDEMLDDDTFENSVPIFYPPQRGQTETIQRLPTPESLQRSSVDDPSLEIGSSAASQENQPDLQEQEQQGGIILNSLLENPNSGPCELASKRANPVTNSSLPTTRMITTSFAHPIDFAYEPPSDGTKPCHWCHDFRYGILGLGTLNVEVIDYHDGNGYIEIEGGHVGQGHDPSRMCIICALERLHIMNCSGHTISPLKASDEKTFNYDAAYESLLQESGVDGYAKTSTLWCMLCPRPAFHGCVTVQSVDKFQESIDPSEPSAKGCGLLLCSDCASLLRKMGPGLEPVVSENKNTLGEDGVRADAVFLLPGNDLWRFYSG